LNGSSRVEEIHDDDDDDDENPTVGGRRAIGYPEYQDSPRPVDGAEAPEDPLETVQGGHEAQNVLQTERHDDHEQWATERRT